MTSTALPAALVALAAAPALAAEGTFTSDGVKIHYVTEGAGEPVVLIHGWMADAGMWGKDKSGNTKLDTRGADGFRLIALDCRGHGKSDKPHDPAQCGTAVADDVIRLLDHLKLDKAHLIGYSSGAFIAGKVAAAHPARVRSVAYCGQAPVIVGFKASDFSEVDAFAEAVEKGTDLADYLISITPADRPKLTKVEAKLAAMYLYAGKDLKAYAAAGLGFKALAVTADQLKACPAPVLFLHGANEGAHVKGRVAAVHKLLGRGEVKLVPGGDHMTTLAKPEFAAALEEFLKANKGK